MPTHTPAGSSQALPAAPASRGRLVVDAPMRMFHWLFALSFVGAYLSAEGERLRLLHVTLGYTMVGLLVFRVLYGLMGPRQARLSVLWRKLGGGPAWLSSLGQGAAGGAINWRQGQNLLMALAIVALLLMALPLTLSGYATYIEWGGEWLAELHEFFGEAFLMVVLGHLGLILLMSVWRRQNQALPMLTGRTQGSGPDLVKQPRRWLAALMLLAVLGFGAWQSWASPKGLIPAGAWADLAQPSDVGDDDDD